ncbi:MAG: hypothetical protein PW786_02260 [Arachidicoccus sp.]|nr:hypothetical protein [Arachidicoccus sp.]
MIQEDADVCSRDNVEACTIQVPSSFVDNPTSDPTLNSSINIGTASALSGRRKRYHFQYPFSLYAYCN